MTVLQGQFGKEIQMPLDGYTTYQSRQLYNCRQQYRHHSNCSSHRRQRHMYWVGEGSHIVVVNGEDEMGAYHTL